ncbi:hypothetical protein KR084_011657 [Drosophila pseudotakahashii]|nr:hypothetical protein KR084_011657 [Drosophila pseudotakahashii]
MRHLWLLLLIAGGSVQFPGVLTSPEALPGTSSSAAIGVDGGGAGGGVTATSGAESNKDYEYEDETPSAAGNLAISTEKPKFPDPYFEQTEVNLYVPVNTTSVKLECPVKNFNSAHHVILWYKGQTLVSNGNNIIDKAYSLGKKFSLTVPLASNATEEQYVCEVPNTKARRQVTIRFGPGPSTTASSAVPVSAVTSSPAKDSAAHGRDISLWLLGLLLAPLQLVGTFHF